MVTTVEALKKSKLVQHQTIDEDYCQEYDKAVSENNEISLQITVETRADYVLIASPKFKKVEDALKWYEQLDYVDSDMYAYIGYLNEYNTFCHIAELEEKE